MGGCYENAANPELEKTVGAELTWLRFGSTCSIRRAMEASTPPATSQAPVPINGLGRHIYFRLPNPWRIVVLLSPRYLLRCPTWLFAFGPFDALAITEFPDNLSAAAISMSFAAGGAVSNIQKPRCC